MQLSTSNAFMSRALPACHMCDVRKSARCPVLSQPFRNEGHQVRTEGKDRREVCPSADRKSELTRGCGELCPWSILFQNCRACRQLRRGARARAGKGRKGALCSHWAALGLSFHLLRGHRSPCQAGGARGLPIQSEGHLWQDRQRGLWEVPGKCTVEGWDTLNSTSVWNSGKHPNMFL